MSAAHRRPSTRLQAILLAGALLAACRPPVRAQAPDLPPTGTEGPAATAALGLDAESAPRHVGDLLGMTLAITHPAGSLALPARLPEAWGSLEIAGQAPPETRPIDDRRWLTRQRIEARAWSTGSLTTLPFSITLMAADGSQQDLAAAPLRFEIAGRLPPGPQLPRDIHGQAMLEAPSRWPRILATLALALAGLFGLAGLALRWLRHRPLPLPPRRSYGPAARLAQQVLAALDAEALLAAGRTLEHYERASACLRAYLEAVYRLPALDRTTSESVALLAARGVPNGLRGRIGRLLDEADLVKFARHQPEPARAADYSDRLRRIVDEIESERRSARALAAIARRPADEAAASA
ncbi:MAG: hypothetical protein KDH92_03770 [Chloroflexi bacterium]|nr:hypothetical protein [Chloroflexota bacterium]